MDLSNLFSLTKALSKELGIKEETLSLILKESILLIMKKKLSDIGEYELEISNAEMSCYQFKEVVESTEGKHIDRFITLEDAVLHDEGVNVGDQIGILLTNEATYNFSRSELALLKQIFSQKIRNHERLQILDQFREKIGTNMSGTITHELEDRFVVNLGKTEGTLSKFELSGMDEFKVGSKSDFCIKNVSSTGRGTEIQLSRSSHLYLINMLNSQISEFDTGEICVLKIARSAGYKSKIVLTSDLGEEAIRIALGPNLSNLHNLSNLLDGERLSFYLDEDISEDYIMRVLDLPSEMYPEIIIDIKENDIHIAAEDDVMGRLIGKRKSNILTAASILGKSITLINKDRLKLKLNAATTELAQISELSDLDVQTLINNDILSIQEFIDADNVLDKKINLNQIKTNLLNNRYILDSQEIDISEGVYKPREYKIPKQKQQNALENAENRLRSELKKLI